MRGRKPTYRITNRDRLVSRADRAVSLAVKSGKLPPLSTRTCVDCGAAAECYDHRDYTRPLKVEPVCKGCNNRRGPGWPYPTPEDGSVHKLDFPNRTKGWGCLDAGEGFAPLEARLISSIDLDLLGESEAAMKDGPLGRFIVDDFYRRAGSARAEYFKRRDPWYA